MGIPCLGSIFRDGSDEVVYDKSLHTLEDGIACAILRGAESVYDYCLLPNNQNYKAEFLCTKTGGLTSSSIDG